MQVIACLLFAVLRLASANTAITLRSMPTRTFGAQVDTEYDDDLKPETREVSEADSDGLTLGITIGTQPLTLRRFGTQKIVVTEVPLKRFGSQIEVLSQVPPEDVLVDGLQRFGAQGSEPSQIPVEPSEYKLQSFGSAQVPEVSEIPVEPKVTLVLESPADQQPITMAEAMSPHGTVGHHEEAEQPSIVLSEAPLRHSWNDQIVVSEVPLSRFGQGAAAADFDLQWHHAWQATPAVSAAPLKVAFVERAGSSTSKSAQEPDMTDSEAEFVMPSFESVVQMWRYMIFAFLIGCIALHKCGCHDKAKPSHQANPLLSA